MMTIDEQLADVTPQWTKLLESLKGDIADDYRCSDDPDDNTPGMCVTIGFTPETEEKNYSWSYQTGDNSYTGGVPLDFWACAGTSALQRARILWNRAKLDAFATLGLN